MGPSLHNTDVYSWMFELVNRIAELRIRKEIHDKCLFVLLSEYDGGVGN